MSEGRVSVETTRDETFDLFKAWAEDRALIRVELRLLRLAATFTVRVAVVVPGTPGEIRFLADDRWAELVIPIPGDVTFRFLDINEFTGGAKFERMLMMFYPFVNDPDEADQVVFAEVNEGTMRHG